MNQIEEMAIILSDGGCKKCDCDANGRFNCKLLYDAELLYKAGYRKYDDLIEKMTEEVDGWKKHFESLYETAKETIKTKIVTETVSEIEQAIMAHGTKYALKRLEEIRKKYEVQEYEQTD